MAEVNDRNIWLHFKVKIDVGSLYLEEEVNDHNIGLLRIGTSIKILEHWRDQY